MDAAQRYLLAVSTSRSARGFAAIEFFNRKAPNKKAPHDWEGFEGRATRTASHQIFN
jgi:hypothetical protein